MIRPIIILGIILLIGLILLLLLVLSRSYYASYWNRRAAQTIASNAIIYVALGDSTAQSVGASWPTRGYVGLLASKLATETNRPVHVVNLGKSGAKIADVLDTQLPLLEKMALKPDFITVEIGANDMSNYDAAKFEKEMDTLLAKLPSETIMSDIPFLGGRTQLPLIGGGQSDRNTIAANKILHSLASKRGITLVPLYQELRIHNRYPWSYAVDYFHPDDLGYQTWFRVFWEGVRATVLNRNEQV